MFETKLKPTTVNKGSSTTNAFLTKGKVKSSKTLSGNGAAKYTTSGSTLIDQFAVAGKYKEPRKFSEISRDADILWAEDPLKAMKFTLFLRTIPRTVSLPDGTKTSSPQKGTELKHEPIMRMIWTHTHSPQSFWNNILLFVSLGSWHDVFTMLQYDLSYNGWNNRKLDWNKFADLILAALQNPNTSELVKKYLPQIKARSACKTIDAQSNNQIAKWLCSVLFGGKENDATTYKRYRKLKTSGTAHSWQKLISQGRFKDINFDDVHGRALSVLVKSKFLTKTGLSDKYNAWLKKPETKVKYTGFVHELFEGYWKGDSTKEETINKQFQTLVDKARQDEITDLIVVRDTSGSMGSICTGTKSSCYDIAKALALYFSEFLKGTFANQWIEFNSTATLQEWKGTSPTAKWKNDRSSYVGGTNFQSVIDLFVDMKKQGVSEADFPKGILCISDSEFNPAQLGQTNVEAARRKLRNAGFSSDYCENFVIILWNLQSTYYGKGTGEKFETAENTKGVYYFGGFSGSVISFLTGKIKTTYEIIEEALSQEVLSLVEI